MTSTDPRTGLPLADTAIQRVLFVARKVHVYNIPPMTSTKGHTAAAWTANDNQRLIFTARLRIIETSDSNPSVSAANSLRTDILLEDPSSGELFANCPYVAPQSVEQAIDSSRFFALRVVGDNGRRKAVLGVGFEERSEAFDFNVSIQDARRVLGMESANLPKHPGRLGRRGADPVKQEEPPKRDFRLKEGETITVNIGGRGRRHHSTAEGQGKAMSETEALFSIKPPPPYGGNGAMPILAPPPSASEVKASRRRSRQNISPPQISPRVSPEMSPQDLGFDDGEFGEFQ